MTDRHELKTTADLTQVISGGYVTGIAIKPMPTAEEHERAYTIVKAIWDQFKMCPHCQREIKR